jgi:hypothetical protein
LTTVYGVVGIEPCYAQSGTCSTEGICPSSFCNKGKCDDVAFLCSWGYFNECQKQNCPSLNNVPWGGGCCYIVYFWNPCANVTVGCNIFDCGPCPGQFYTAYYCDYYGTNEQLLSCLTKAAWGALTNYANPKLGLSYAQCTPQNATNGCTCCGGNFC